MNPRVVIGESQLPGARERLGGKSFVDFDNVKIVQAESQALQQLVGCRHRSDTHYPRGNTGDGHTQDPSPGLQLVARGRRFRCQEQGGSTVIDAGGITRRHRTLRKQRLQLCELLQ